MEGAELIRHIASNRGMHSLVTPTRPLALRPDVGVAWDSLRLTCLSPEEGLLLSRPIAGSVDGMAEVSVR